MDIQQIAKRIAGIENKPLDETHFQEAKYYQSLKLDGIIDCFNISVHDICWVLSGGWIYNKERIEKLGLVDDTYYSRLEILKEIKHSYDKMDNLQKSIIGSFLIHHKKQLTNLSTDKFLSIISSIVNTKKVVDTAETIKSISKTIQVF